ncbi:hypothetical protein [Tropicibacter oceani]|uniref:Uncharacterized protein n=1 Tax=Tropicibacter oceani TaxID=3058420 RepID=A0ABY8QJP8_9RHOB|nr:hypothetical protein [Tropicibacter oceani]WGW04678.1 hypothetical protein QF118_03760 [Tropicibacter oceani]
MTMLLMYCIVPLVITVPLLRFVLFRRLFGFKDMRKGVKVFFSEHGQDARTIYNAGTKRGPKQIGGMALFEATKGAKYLPPLLIVWIVILLFQMGEMRGGSDWIALVVFLAGSAYLCTLNYRLRIVLDGNEMHKLDWRFRHQTYDLAQLVWAEQDSSESYRLEFEDGRSAYILRWITGHDVFKDCILNALEINKR